MNTNLLPNNMADTRNNRNLLNNTPPSEAWTDNRKALAEKATQINTPATAASVGQANMPNSQIGITSAAGTGAGSNGQSTLNPTTTFDSQKKTRFDSLGLNPQDYTASINSNGDTAYTRNHPQTVAAPGSHGGTMALMTPEEAEASKRSHKVIGGFGKDTPFRAPDGAEIISQSNNRAGHMPENRYRASGLYTNGLSPEFIASANAYASKARATGKLGGIPLGDDNEPVFSYKTLAGQANPHNVYDHSAPPKTEVGSANPAPQVAPQVAAANPAAANPAAANPAAAAAAELPARTDQYSREHINRLGSGDINPQMSRQDFPAVNELSTLGLGSSELKALMNGPNKAMSKLLTPQEQEQIQAQERAQVAQVQQTSDVPDIPTPQPDYNSMSDTELNAQLQKQFDFKRRQYLRDTANSVNRALSFPSKWSKTAGKALGNDAHDVADWYSRTRHNNINSPEDKAARRADIISRLEQG